MTLNTHSRQKHWVGRCRFQPFFSETPSVTTYASAVTHPVTGGERGNFQPEKDECCVLIFHHTSPMASEPIYWKRKDQHHFLSPLNGKEDSNPLLCTGIIVRVVSRCRSKKLISKVSNNWKNLRVGEIQNEIRTSKKKINI